MTTKTDFITWFETFLNEKQLPFELFDIHHKNETHMIDTDFVTELIKEAPLKEQQDIKSMIVKIDFVNGDINHFFKHLATCYVQCNY